MHTAKVICIDFHGTLTNGVLNIAHDGSVFESVSVRDIRAIRELVAHGYEVYIVTQSESKIIDSYCRKVGCEKVILRDKSAIPFKNYIALGDDVPDVPMLKQSARAFCPSNADQSVLSLENITVLNAQGGNAVIAELVHHLLHPSGEG